jgi:hypothetical protein
MEVHYLIRHPKCWIIIFFFGLGKDIELRFIIEYIVA